jgi:hypothetical protein
MNPGRATEHEGACAAVSIASPESSVRDPLQAAALASLLAACLFIMTTPQLGDADLWGHVRYGQDVLANTALPSTATHTFTAVGHAWINHENLSEIVFAVVANSAGASGLASLSVLLGLFLLALMVVHAMRQGVSFGVLSLSLLLAVANISFGWSVRPQIFTYTCFAALVVLLGETAWRRRLWLAVPLFAVWANFHGGFVAGLAVFGLCMACRALQSTWRQRAEYVALLLACVLATLLNPYGAGLLRWLVYDLGPPRPEIGEWDPLRPPSVLFFPVTLLLVVTVAAWIGSGRRRDLGQTAALGVTAWQAYAHARHAPFFGILAGFWLPYHLEGLRLRLLHADAKSTAPPSARAVGVVRAVAWGTALAMLVAVAVLSRTMWVPRREYPVEALQFMVDHRLSGRLVAHFDWAQYALAALAPGTTVAFDGRLRTCYPQAVADTYFDFLLGDTPSIRWRSPDSPPFDDTRILRLGNPDLVLVSRRFKHGVKVMQRRSGWTLLYQDHLAQLWGRPDRYGDVASTDYVPPAARVIGERPQRGFVRWPAFPVSGGT